MKAFYKIIFIGVFFCSCGNGNPVNTKVTPENIKKPMMDVNKILVQKESDEIDQFVKMRNWDMVQTGTGLRIMIYEHGTGDSAKAGKRAKINYKISLLDGTECYSSEKSGPKEFLIGQDYVETGLHEGIQLLRTGDKAILILPSHLALGLLGDFEKIPARSTIVYDVELISLR